ncbi:MAG TPA: DinB family protein, partial [Pseudonocardiaceae bacterium]
MDTGLDPRVDLDWTRLLVDQLDWHWQHHLRPRLDGITDEEYLWEPVAGCWNIRRRGASAAPIVAGSGEYTVDFAFPEPKPAPVTTIAWRLGHVIVGVFGARVASHFGGPPVSYQDFRYAGTARDALGQLDEVYAAWTSGVRDLDAAGLARPCGSAEGPYADVPL